MTLAIIIPASACALMAFAALALLALRRHRLAGMGSLSCSLGERRPFQFVGVLLISPALVIIPAVRALSVPVSIALSAVGILLFAISFRDILHAGISGAYERGIVWRGAFVPYDSILSMERPDPFTLVVVSRRRGARTVISGPQEMVDAVFEAAEKKRSPLP
jgi:hypothetical protein